MTPTTATVLIIDDEEIIREALEALLVMEGYHVVTAATGAFYFPNDNWNVDPESVNRAHGRLWEVRDSQILRCWSRGPSPQNFALFDKAAWRKD